jgi:nucleotide-binding universal stress UspA family protein
MFKKILVAVDGSSHSDRAVQAAAEMAAAGGAQLTLCHVFYIPEHYRSDLIGELRAAIRKDGEDILVHAVRVAKQSGLEAESRLLEEGHPAEAVIGLAHAEGSDLIVAGARGKSRDAIRALGSVSWTIAKLAKCSVMIVRHA